MTEEEKDLLLKELSARLPYNPIVEYKGETYNVLGITHGRLVLCKPFMSITLNECPLIEEVKLYLFPMLSMTEEQKKKCNFADDLDSDILDAALSTNHYHRTGIPTVTYNLVDWCTENHFDYRGLIPMGLAKDATGLGIY